MMCTVMVYFLLLVVSSNNCQGEDEPKHVPDTELVMAFMIHRHGDRSPVQSTMKFVTDQEKMSELLKTTGYGQLTNAGKRTSYKTGAYIRHRYNSLLSSEYNHSEIYIRSTPSTRAKMTVLAAMAAVYPAVEPWCGGVKRCDVNRWTPVPYYMESGIYDFNVPFFNCPVYITFYKDALAGPAPQMSKHFKFLNEWSKVIDYNITERPTQALMIYDAYISQISMGIPLEPKLVKMWPSIEKAAATAFDVVFGDEDHIHLGAGVLLNEFFKAAKNIISNEDVPKVYVFSGHDINVFSFLKVTKVKIWGGQPKYGSLYSLELRRVVPTGEYVVVPIYLKSPENSKAVRLKIEGCDDFCELSKFYDLVSKYALDVKEWRKQCEWSEDYNFDFSIIE